MDGEHLRRLLVGEEWRRTRVALALAGVLFVVGGTVDYFSTLALVTGERTIWMEVAKAYVVKLPYNGYFAPSWIPGYVLVSGLAAIHTYFNYGYVTSVLLAISPNMGMGLWSPRVVTSPNYNEYVMLTPVNVFDVSLLVLLVANVGFVVGLALREILRTTPASPGNPHVHER